MTKKLEENERIRKEYAPRGQRGQKRFTLLIDNENVEWLYSQGNMGRYVNQLIKDDQQRRR